MIITRPDDFHVHFRDGECLRMTVPATARCFGRAVAMPNLKPPVTTAEAASAYRERIREMAPKGSDFQPLMALYLTDQTTPEIVQAAKDTAHVIGFKLYPAGATTHSEAGVTSLEGITPALERMQALDLPLLIHGESVDDKVDIFDRERHFIDNTLTQLVRRFPELRMVLEHVSTQEGVDFVQATNNIAATITVHHLLLNRDDMLVGGMQPHYYCLPVLKARQHQEAIIKAAISGNPKFFFGSDSAPHLQSSKEGARGSAGIFSAPVAIELCAEIFQEADAIDRLEGFTSFYGADFYRLPRNESTITLEKQSWQVPDQLSCGEGYVVPLWAGKSVRWSVVDDAVADNNTSRSP